MFSFGYSFFLSGPIIGYTSLSYFYIFSIVFYMIHYFDTIAKHPFLVALQMHPYQCSSLQYPPRIDKPAPSLIHHTLKRCLDVYAESPLLEKSEYAVTANDLKNKSDIPILLFLACTGYQ